MVGNQAGYSGQGSQGVVLGAESDTSQGNWCGCSWLSCRKDISKYRISSYRL